MTGVSTLAARVAAFEADVAARGGLASSHPVWGVDLRADLSYRLSILCSTICQVLPDAFDGSIEPAHFEKRTRRSGEPGQDMLARSIHLTEYNEDDVHLPLKWSVKSLSIDASYLDLPAMKVRVGEADTEANLIAALAAIADRWVETSQARRQGWW